MPNERKTVVISSTARDLPEHRKEVMDACLRQGMFPIMMEHLPANDDEAISASLKMVDEADIFVGIFAYRYGYIPKESNSQQISVTEMEYNRAVERKIPRLIFVMDKSHHITADDMDIENAGKLKTFKDHIQTDNIVNFFKSPADLRAHVINSLSQYRESDITQFHYVSDIPQPPEAYVAHPYILLQTPRLIGRQKELNLLTSWITKKQEPIYWARIMNIVAIGGMGKSALTWKWFNEIAPQEMKPLAGRMWWSFYESDATFENFVVRALAYVSKRSREDTEKNTKPGEREEQLLQILDHEPYLLVLDGLERILIAYARMDAARLSDDDIDERTANFVVKAYGLPESAAQSFVGQHLLRKTSDPRAGAFLRKLANLRSARILVSTRLYPADLQSVTGEPIKGCSAVFLLGLNDNDALDLWRTFHVSGSRETLLPLFHKFENHPLLMQSLASEISNYRRAPGDFERWQKDHPNFDPFSLPMTQVKGHVLAFAMQGLYDSSRKVLETIAAFRMPARYDTLAAIFVGKDKIFPTELGLDQALRELEDRGLLGWDKRANRYDLHPIVRGVVWGKLSDETRDGVFTSLQTHFDSVPEIDADKVGSIEDLTPAIELYNTLIGLGRYDEALLLFDERPFSSTIDRLNATRQALELLNMLMEDNINGHFHLTDFSNEVSALVNLVLCNWFGGQPDQALRFHQRLINRLLEKNIRPEQALRTEAGFFWIISTEASVLTGAIHNGEMSARLSLSSAKNTESSAKNTEDRFVELISLYYLGFVLSIRGIYTEAKIVLKRMNHMAITDDDLQIRGWAYALLAQIDLWQNGSAAPSYTNRALEIAAQWGVDKRDLIRAERLVGTATLNLSNFGESENHLVNAITKAREINYIQEELQLLITIAELRRRQGNPQVARELLDNMWEYAERGPYPLFHTDAFNVLAQIERDEDNKDKAIEAATKAYRLAWCDGPPYAYYWGLEKAKQHLKELSALEPEMPPFDESKFEPMPEVEINPKDEYWVDPDKDLEIDDLEK